MMSMREEIYDIIYWGSREGKDKKIIANKVCDEIYKRIYKIHKNAGASEYGFELVEELFK